MVTAFRDPKKLALRTIRNGWLIIFLLAAGDIVLNHMGGLASPINRSFNIAREDAIGTWFSILQLVAASVITRLLYRQARDSGAADSVRRCWGYLSVLFLYMSIDDAAKIHERLGTLFSDGVTFFPSYSWQVVYAPVFGMATLVFLFVAWKVLADNIGRIWTVLGVGFLITAVGLDFLEGIEPSDKSGASGSGQHSGSIAAPAKAFADFIGTNGHNIEHLQRVLEESMEMAAITLFLGAFILQLGRSSEGLGINFTDPGTTDVTENTNA